MDEPNIRQEGRTHTPQHRDPSPMQPVKPPKKEVKHGDSVFHPGDYIIYQNGDSYELGRIKSLRPDGAFVAYHSGETGAKTPYDVMHPLRNAYTIEKTTLGGSFFEEAHDGD